MFFSFPRKQLETGRGSRMKTAKDVAEHPSMYRGFFAPTLEPEGSDAASQEARERLHRIGDGEPPNTWEQYLSASHRPK